MLGKFISTNLVDAKIHRPPRILFLNTGAKHNLGDRAMLLNVLWHARQRYPTADFYVEAGIPVWMVHEFSLTPVSTMANCWARGGDWARAPYAIASTLILRLLLVTGAYRHLPTGSMEHELLKAIDAADLIWLVGGGYLNDLGTHEARGVLSTARLGQGIGRMVVMTGQGIGPFSKLYSRWLFRSVAKKAQSIVLREPIFGMKIMATLHDKKIKVRVGVDDACSLQSGTTETTAPAILAMHFRRSSFHEHSEELEQALSGLVTHLVAKGERVKLFVFSERKATEHDFYLKWKQASGNPKAVDIIEYSDPRNTLAELATCQCAIGMAYHFHLFALLSGIPSLAMYSGTYYESKYRGVDVLFEQSKSFFHYDMVDECLLKKFVGSENRLIQPERSRSLLRTAERLKQQASEQIDEALDHLSKFVDLPNPQ